ncbi:MAG: SH3-like domain-containing protein [Cyanobacteria bacterium J06576_12]
MLGKAGKIVNFQGMFRNPEDVAHFKPTVLQLPLYLVEFEFVTVWGKACPARCMGDTIRAEIYEPWLSLIT